MTLLEDEVETQLNFTQASFAAHRQQELEGKTPSALDLLKLLKARCEKQREKQQRQSVSKAAAVTVTADNKKPASAAQKDQKVAAAAALKQKDKTKPPTRAADSKQKDACQLSQIGKCPHVQDASKCKYTHRNDLNSKPNINVPCK